MFYLYKFNKLNMLFSKICKIVKNKPLSNIFEKEVIIHDNQILFQYLNIFVANYTGISSDFKLIYPNIFIWKIFQKILPINYTKNIFNHTTNIWKIMKIMEEYNFIENIKINDNQIKKFEFALKIENLFQKYLLYRPNKLKTWYKKKVIKINPEELWQIKLWNKIINNHSKSNKFIKNFSNFFDIFKFLIKKKN